MAARKKAASVDDVDPESVQHHRSALENVQVPLIAHYEKAKVGVALRGGVDGEGLDRAKDAADQNERRGPVEHDADCSNVRGEHAVADASAVDQSHQADEDDLDHALQDQRDAEQCAAGESF